MEANCGICLRHWMRRRCTMGRAESESAPPFRSSFESFDRRMVDLLNSLALLSQYLWPKLSSAYYLLSHISLLIAQTGTKAQLMYLVLRWESTCGLSVPECEDGDVKGGRLSFAVHSRSSNLFRLVSIASFFLFPFQPVFFSFFTFFHFVEEQFASWLFAWILEMATA